MQGVVRSLWRYPVKGFTPEPLDRVALTAGGFFPCDRIYAVENGASGFDPAAPAHMSKQKLAVLASLAQVAGVRTRYDEPSGTFSAEAEGRAPIRAVLREPQGQEAFAAWLSDVLGDAARGPLKVLPGPNGHRFTDSRSGFVSVVNLASVRDLEDRVGRPVDPLRFRANLYVDDWPAWAENDLEGAIRLGETEVAVLKPIVRCAATHVDPRTAERDMDVTGALFDAYGHILCGIYVAVTRGGEVAINDPASA